MELQAPVGGFSARASVSRCRPAIKAIDAMTPIGRGSAS
jgi:F0F1-type ATP synthase alpha subunit